VPRNVLEVLIGAEECQAVPDAKLGNQRIDCPYLNSRATTGVAERGSARPAKTRSGERRRTAPDDLFLPARFRARRAFAMIANPRQRDHQSGLPRFSVTSDAYTGAAALPQEVRT
jgi:hypothetical protein